MPALTPTPTMTDPTPMMRLMWLASPTLPVGGYSYSEGLEPALAAVAHTGLRDEASVQTWLLNQLHLSWARSEAPLMLAALAAWRCSDLARLKALNDWCLQTRESAELRRQSEQMGRSLAVWLAQAQADGIWPQWPVALEQTPTQALAPAPTWPVMFAAAAACAEASPQDAVTAFGFGWAEAQAQAAIKTTPLGQTAGQRVLAALVAALPAAAQAALQVKDAQRQCFSPALAILSAQHETQYTRIFRS
ncbi:MAG: urease accessory UreF family protein [Ideonella sp.]|nr:urease accessory UreF family protein [Ideonella sp.]